MTILGQLLGWTAPKIQQEAQYAVLRDWQVDVYNFQPDSLTETQRGLLGELVVGYQLGSEKPKTQLPLAQDILNNRYAAMGDLKAAFSKARLEQTRTPAMPSSDQGEPIAFINSDGTGYAAWANGTAEDPSNIIVMGIADAKVVKKDGIAYVDKFSISGIFFDTNTAAIMTLRATCCGADDRIIIRGRNQNDGMSVAFRLTADVSLNVKNLAGGWFPLVQGFTAHDHAVHALQHATAAEHKCGGLHI